MDRNSWSVRVKEERKSLSFFKTFASADLSSECMRTFPFNFMKSLPKEDFSNKMVIIAKWGSTWEVDISKNPRFYYMEKSGWNQFVRDNALGKREFVTFTHRGVMRFNVNIYGHDQKEIVTPRNIPTMAPSSGIKQEQGAPMGGIEFEKTEKKAEESKTSKKIKKVVNSVEIGECSRRVKLNVSKTSKMKKVKRDGVRAKNGVPEFEITIKKSGLVLLRIPYHFKKHMPNVSKMFTIHDSKGSDSWEMMCLVRRTGLTFSKGWITLAQEYPLEIGDKCTLQLIKPNEFLLTVSKKTSAYMGRVEVEVTEKKAEECKKMKKVVNSMEIGESSKRVELNVREKNANISKTSTMSVPKFEKTIKSSGLSIMAIPTYFQRHMPNESKMFTIHHSKGSGSWEVMCLVRRTGLIFSKGWITLAQEYPLGIGDKCTFQLIKPNEFLLTITKKAREEITITD